MTIISRVLLVLVAVLLTPYGYASVGGGATIHNAATVDFGNGTATSSVNVTVDTIGTAPVFGVGSTNININQGDTATFNYTITSASNGSDTYSLSAASTDTDVSAPASGPNVSNNSVTLGASITSASANTGTVFIPAGSGSDLQVGDEVVITISGSDEVYEITAKRAGSPASTTGNTTTAEVPTELDLTAVSGGPGITSGNVPAGTQIGERRDFTTTLDGGTPNTQGVQGTHELNISGTTAATDTTGSVISYNDGVNATATVLSPDLDVTKEVRNITEGTGFQSSGVSAQTGDELEYRVTATNNSGSKITSANLTDEVPDYTSYVTSSTVLNTNSISDSGTTPFPLDEGGTSIQSNNGNSGEIIQNESAVVKFRVTVD